MRATYDTNSSRAVCVYSDDSQSDDGYAVVVSVSGTTPTFGSAVEFSTVNCLTLDCCFDSNSNKVVIAYKASDQGKRHRSELLVERQLALALKLRSQQITQKTVLLIAALIAI